MSSHLLYMNLYTIFLLVMGSVALFVATIILLRYKSAVWLFGMVMLLVAVWSIGYGLELSQRTLAAIYQFIQIEYIGISLLPAFWIIFIIKYTGNDEWLGFKSTTMIFVVPVITLALVITNQWHHLYYESLSAIEIGKLILLDIQPGPWYKIHTAYFYFTMLWGAYLLFRHMQKASYNYRVQNIILFLAALVPWVTNVLYLSGFRVHQHIDPTPFAFILTCFLIIYGLFRYKLFSLIPIARDLIVQQMQEAVIILDNNNKIVDYNDRAMQILPVGNQQSMSAESVFSEIKHLIFALNDSSVKRLEIDWQDETYEVNINSIVNRNEKTKGKFLLFREITQFKEDTMKMNEQAIRLHKLNSLKDRLLSIISHDIRGPLNNLKKLMSLLSSGKMNASEFKKLLPEMGEKLTETSMIMDNLLFWAKNQIQGLAPEQESIYIHKIVFENFKLFKQQALNKQIKLINKIPKKFTIHSDKNVLDIVLRNLISNAIKFSQTDGKVVVSGEYHEKMSIITVDDFGLGMDTKTQQRILNNENFSNPGTHQEMGAGIGLHLCKEFLEKIGGSISLRSEEGKGTSIYLNFPNKIVARELG